MSVARNIFRAIHEGRWLSIEYVNAEKKTTRYWISINNIEIKNKDFYDELAGDPFFGCVVLRLFHHGCGIIYADYVHAFLGQQYGEQAGSAAQVKDAAARTDFKILHEPF